MFDAYCGTCGARSLFGPRRIISLRPGPDGLVARFRCYCGAVGTTRFDTASEDVPLGARAG